MSAGSRHDTYKNRVLVGRRRPPASQVVYVASPAFTQLKIKACPIPSTQGMPSTLGDRVYMNNSLCSFCLYSLFVQDKVDVVKTTMQDNIQQMLSNEERLDQISQNAEGLNEQVCKRGASCGRGRFLWSATRRDGPSAGSTAVHALHVFLPTNRGLTGDLCVVLSLCSLRESDLR